MSPRPYRPKLLRPPCRGPLEETTIDLWIDAMLSVTTYWKLEMWDVNQKMWDVSHGQYDVVVEGKGRKMSENLIWATDSMVVKGRRASSHGDNTIQSVRINGLLYYKHTGIRRYRMGMRRDDDRESEINKNNLCLDLISFLAARTTNDNIHRLV